MNEQEKKYLKEKALKQFLNGEPLFGKDGAFSPMLKEFLETALVQAYIHETCHKFQLFNICSFIKRYNAEPNSSLPTAVILSGSLSSAVGNNFYFL